MAFDAHKNFAKTTVAAAPAPATTGTSLTVEAGTGGLFPATPFNATVWPAASEATATNAEIVRVTNRAVDVLTIERKVEGTSARTIVIGDQIEAGITAKTATDIEAAATGTVGPAGPAGPEGPAGATGAAGATGPAGAGGSLTEEVKVGAKGGTETIKLDLSKASLFKVEINATVKTIFEIINAPANPQEVDLIVIQDATGGRVWEIKSVSWVGNTPTFSTGAKVANLVSLLSLKSATEILGLGSAEGTGLGVDSVITEYIKNEAVTSSKIAGEAVGTTQLAASAVTGAKILNGTIGTSKIENGSINNEKIGATAIKNNVVEDKSLEGKKLKDEAIGTTQLGAEAVTSAKLLKELRRLTALEQGRQEVTAVESVVISCPSLPAKGAIKVTLESTGGTITNFIVTKRKVGENFEVKFSVALTGAVNWSIWRE